MDIDFESYIRGSEPNKEKRLQLGKQPLAYKLWMACEHPII